MTSKNILSISQSRTKHLEMSSRHSLLLSAYQSYYSEKHGQVTNGDLVTHLALKLVGSPSKLKISSEEKTKVPLSLPLAAWQAIDECADYNSVSAELVVERLIDRLVRDRTFKAWRREVDSSTSGSKKRCQEVSGEDKSRTDNL